VWKTILFALVICSSPRVYAGQAPRGDVSAEASEADVPVPVENPQVEKIPASTLTPEERDILARGMITDREATYGQIAGTLVGFGTGQMFQKRYMNTGLILTVGEASATALIAFGFSTCSDGGFNGSAPGSKRCSVGAGIVGIAGLIGLKTWEIIDVWTAPDTQNAQYRFLKSHLIEDKKTSSLEPSLSLIPAVDQAVNTIDGVGIAYQIKF
jgi:hypothetical protein